MPSFAYRSVDAKNKIVTGVQDARDATAVARNLEGEGLLPLSIVEQFPQNFVRDYVERRVALGKADLIALIANLEMLLSAGIDLNTALGSLARSSGKADTKRLVGDLRERVQKGQSLSDALASAEVTVPGFVLSSIRAGENSGQLRPVLAKLADYLTRFEKFRSDLVSSLIYPAILLIMAIVTIIVLVTVVVPQFKPLFEDAGADLPLLTRIVVGVSDLVLDHAAFILIGVATLVLVSRRLLGEPHLALALDRLKLSLPLGAGALLGRIEVARFTRLMALLLENGLPLPSTLLLVQDAAGNRFFAAALDTVAAKVREGSRLTTALSASRLIPPGYQQVLEAGEEASQLEVVLNRVANLSERETETALKNFMAAFVPLLTILLGGFVAIIIMSVMFAMLSLNDLAFR